MRVLALLVLALFSLTESVSAACPHASASTLEPQVNTVAGNGVPALLDGPALAASFVEPYGIAVGPDRSIYVTDMGANTIRRIRGGAVETLAGVSLPGPTKLQRIGGYLDGSASQAKFLRPMGIAVAKDGTLYVADTANRAIRKIANGVVSTFAGKSEEGGRDGAGAEARFTWPVALTIDDDGNLYVADRGVGIRKITPAGVVTTLSLPHDKRVCGVSARGRRESLLLAYTDSRAMRLARGPNLAVQELPFETKREPTGEYPQIVGPACGIAALQTDAVAVADDYGNDVRFVRFPLAPPVGSGPIVRTLAGGFREGSTPISGYRDGSTDVALADVPRALAFDSDGTLFFADAGNRRVRSVTGIDPRGPLLDVGELNAPSSTYRVVVLGNSVTFNNVLWPESMGGQIESILARDGASVGLTKCPHIITTRFSSMGISDARSWAETYLADGEADLVVFVTNPAGVSHELDEHPELKAGDRWKSDVPAQLRQLGARLAKSKTRLLVVVVPSAQRTSTLEMVMLDGGSEFVDPLREAREFEDVFVSSGVRTMKLIDTLEKLEESPNRVMLFNTSDPHPSTEGSVVIGREIARELMRWRPWSRP